MAKSAFYAVQVGRQPGVYKTWDECKAQVDGYPKSKYKKFGSEAEANAFVTGVEEVKEQNTSVSKESVVSEPKGSDVVIPDGPYAFVDGSFNPETGTYGYGGFVCAGGNMYPIMGNGRDPEMSKMRNVSGEIEGAMAAVRKAEELQIRELTILYDYKGIEEWAKGNWKTTKDGTKAYAEFMNPENRLTAVKFQKVAAHTGIEGNEMADVMAKLSVGIALTPSQSELATKALSMGKSPVSEQRSNRMDGLSFYEERFTEVLEDIELNNECSF